MKKLILSLLIFFSAISQAQIQIPQVVGLPAALAGKVDKATGKSLVADTLSAKIQPTAVAVTTKEPLLPSTPSNPESRFLNGNKQWAEIVLGSGGYASNVYFTNLTSTIVGSYKQTSGTHELTETIASGTCNNNEVLIYTYLFEQPVGITTVDAGVWRFTMNSKINSNVGDSKFKIVQFRRSSTGVETDMFTIYSNTIENTDYQNFIIETVQPSFLVDSLDRFGCRIYATTNTTVNKTISYKVGDGFASYLNTPLVPRHDQFRALNGNPNVQHLTAAQVSKVNNTSGVNTGDETTATIKSKLGFASSASSGYLKNTDWVTFNDKQPAGNYSTDIHSNITALNSVSGTNTGDETLTSIKTKLGAASAVSDGYLKYQDWVSFRDKISTETDPTIYAWAKSANKPIYTFSEVGAEQSFSKNTAFNKNFGTTPGTVLEGRTFGTAANSAVGDFIQNQNSSPQSASVWIGGSIKGETLKCGNSGESNSTYKGHLTLSDIAINGPNSVGGIEFISSMSNNGYGVKLYTNNSLDQFGISTRFNTVSWTEALRISLANNSATFASTVNATGFLLNGNNLTSSLSSNYLPKWNGSSMVNSLISDDGTNAQLGNGAPFTSGAKFNIIGTTHGLISQTSGAWGAVLKNTTTNLECDLAGAGDVSVQTNGRIVSTSTTQSTSPTTGALVVNGGVGADHVRANNFYGNGSNLTGVQLPITLTTNGTSGAATFENGVMNVPNYTQSATGSSYSCTFTNILNTSLSLGLMSDYTTVGNVISIAIHGGVSSTGSGKCTFRLSLPTAASPSYKFVVTASDASKTTGRNIFVEATASNYVDVSFLATAASEVIEFTIVGNGHQ